MKRRSGVYIYRTRKPAAHLNIPLLSRHFAYVGETTSFYHRHQQHMYGLSNFGGCEAKCWNDLAPACYRIPLPAWKWLLRTVETLVILVTWPVYNVRKNRWNPRRIRPGEAMRQRRYRDQGWPAVNVQWGHVVLALSLFVAILIWVGR